ncbi:MAG: hypothetical protein JSR80_05360 [Verrucomicrobia bacterium]|nr:hypothetical protein [Verrucomicrobiota bacterium]
MQIFGQTTSGEVIHVDQADRKCEYFCPSCRAPLRLRAGTVRCRHFYHPRTRHCKGKSLPHQQTQAHLLSRLTNARVEHPFPQIGRIADVYWENFVFEVQCSPISADEVQKRNEDYAKLGLRVVWILHDRRFNRLKVTPAELFLADQPHHFTNIDKEGKGEIYDQKRVYLRRHLKFREKRSLARLGQSSSSLLLGEERKTPYLLRIYLGFFHLFLRRLSYTNETNK